MRFSRNSKVTILDCKKLVNLHFYQRHTLKYSNEILYNRLLILVNRYISFKNIINGTNYKFIIQRGQSCENTSSHL